MIQQRHKKVLSEIGINNKKDHHVNNFNNRYGQ